MTSKRLGGGLVGFRLRDRVHHDVVLRVRNPLRGHALGLAGTCAHVRINSLVLAGPRPPLALHLFFRRFPLFLWGLLPVFHDRGGREMQNQEFFHGLTPQVRSPGIAQARRGYRAGGGVVCRPRCRLRVGFAGPRSTDGIWVCATTAGARGRRARRPSSPLLRLRYRTDHSVLAVRLIVQSGGKIQFIAGLARDAIAEGDAP